MIGYFKSFIICYTPFHCHLARQIVLESDNPKDIAILVYASDEVSPFSNAIKLLENVDINYRIYRSNSFIDLLGILYLLYTSKVNALYVGNLKKAMSRFLYKLASPRFLYSFDDGFGNVSGAGYLYNFNVDKFSIKLFGFLLRVPSYCKLVSNIEYHYTIYPRLPNLYSPTKYLDINKTFIDFDSEINFFSDEEFSVFIGSPLSESKIIEVEKEFELIQVAKRLSGSRLIYICHPRESKKKLEKLRAQFNVELIELDELAEAFIIRNKESISSVIGVFSTVLLNVTTILEAKTYALKLSQLGYDKQYAVLEAQGVNIIDF